MPSSSLTLRRFTRFYAPLAATSLLLTATNPLLTSAMSRSVNPAIALAGFGVAFSLCGVLYSPLLVGQQVAATKLLTGSLFWTDFSVSGSGSAWYCLSSQPRSGSHPLESSCFSSIMGVSGDIFDEARAAIVLLAPVSAPDRRPSRTPGTPRRWSSHQSDRVGHRCADRRTRTCRRGADCDDSRWGVGGCRGVQLGPPGGDDSGHQSARRCGRCLSSGRRRGC